MGAGAVTGVGSLPHTDPDRAVAFVAQHAAEVPFWPQLPRRGPGEGMVAQALLAPQALLDGAAALRPFLRALQQGRFSAARAVKGQVCGPITLAHAVGGHPLGEGGPDHVAQVAAQAVWQVRALGANGLPVIVVVDEPALGSAPVTVAELAGLGRVLAAIRSAGAVAGLHTCATGPLVLPSPRPDLLSLDLHGAGVAGHPALWGGGGLVAAGLVPTTGDPLPSVDVLVDRLAAAIGTTDPADAASRTLVTATCGLAGLDEAEAADRFALAAAVGARIRDLAGPS
ncbi:hypothetical protein BH23ACT9_BH23ACT9_22510 [soil metagenome]